ncbi:hypothetical protein [Burkholderia sp. PU8-34]
MTDITIHHTPGCGTSRNARATIRHACIEPHAVRDLDTPQDDAEGKHV